MTERPIIFNGDMVRAILRGEKTQTRRPVKPQPATGCIYSINGAHNAALHLTDAGCQVRYIPPTGRSKDHLLLCPFGQPGDRLWVRETWRLADPDGDDAVSEDVYGPYAPFVGGNGSRKIRWRVIYRATSPESHPKYGKALWTPSIHMPRWASRITLEIIDVRVERVQDINESEAQAEGVRPAFSHPGLDGVVSQPSYRWGFWRLWDKLYAERGLGWDVNPWVWAITFRRVESSHGG